MRCHANIISNFAHKDKQYRRNGNIGEVVLTTFLGSFVIGFFSF